MSVTDYEQRVESACAALRQVAGAVLEDVDVDIGGVGWWDGQVDFRRRVVLSEYLLDSINGAAEALLDASLEAQTHRESLNADDTWLRAVWHEAAKAGARRNEEFLAAMNREGVPKRRERQIDSSATHVVSHLLHSLDCIAAAMVIVGAVPHPVRRADWLDVVRFAEQCRDERVTPKLEPPGTPGRDVQAALFVKALDNRSHGPEDWLEWLFATRNSRIHRGARVHWLMLHGTRRDPRGLLRPFPQHPDLTDVEMMARGPKGREPDAFSSVRMMKHSAAILDGCIDSMTSFVNALAAALSECWEARRVNPALLIQRGAQWQDLERVADLRFPGYGPDVRTLGDKVHVPTELGKRLRSAHVMDGMRDRWTDDR